METKDIVTYVDHTLLTQGATWKEIKQICDDALTYGTASVCIPPSYVKQAKDYVQDAMAVCTVIGFPNGYMTTATKVFETEDALANGADEIDMVINIGWLKDKKYKVESVKVKHFDSTVAYGFNISEKEKRVFISGDSCLCNRILDNVAFCSLAILDCSFATGNKSHMGVDNIKFLLNEYERPTIVTHLSDESEKLLSEIEDDNLLLLDDLAEIEL